MSSRTPSQAGSRPPASPKSHDLRRAVALWLGDGRAQGHTAKTHDERHATMERFAWWLENEAGLSPTLDSLDPHSMRAFLSYLREPRPEGRWGTDHANARRTMRPSAVDSYYRILRAFANWCGAEGLLDTEPLKNVKAPRIPNDQIQPFSDEQVTMLLSGARNGPVPQRDEAILLILLDSGMRVSELCQLNCGDADRGEGRLWVTGKGNKRRPVFIGKETRRALWRYREHVRYSDNDGRIREPPADAPLFVAVSNRYQGQRLTTNGVHNLVSRAGARSGITGVRCSPHTCRHTFAVSFLRNGGNIFELQMIMGHEDLTVLRRYVALAQADVEDAHRRASPVDRRKRR